MSVHNLHHEHMEAGDVYIGRAGHGQDGYFGNPYRLHHGQHRGATIAQFEEYARNRALFDDTYRERVKQLHGKRLFCFCAPHPCHGHVLERLAAELVEEDAPGPADVDEHHSERFIWSAPTED